MPCLREYYCKVDRMMLVMSVANNIQTLDCIDYYGRIHKVVLEIRRSKQRLSAEGEKDASMCIRLKLSDD